jgi:hypothetical protein
MRDYLWKAIVALLVLAWFGIGTYLLRKYPRKGGR